MRPVTYGMIRTLSASLAGIREGTTDIAEFATAASLPVRTAGHIMEQWLDMGIGAAEGDAYRYGPGERLEAGIKLLESGADVGNVAPYLRWQDFEGLTGQILYAEGYEVVRNHIMTKPRMEIDVIGIRLDMALLIDCKHWMRRSSLAGSVARQRDRARRWSGMHQMPAIPVVVTLLEGPKHMGRMPVVPISEFRDFAAGIFGNLEGVEIISAG